MGVQERKLRQKKMLRQEILEAASELFVEEGYEHVSMRRIAEKIEYSPTTIYLYFKDKAELLEEVCRDTFQRLIVSLTSIMEQPGDPVERLKRGLLAYIEFGLTNPHHYRATFLMPVPPGFDNEKFKTADAPASVAFDFLRRAVLNCLMAGRLKSGDVELISQTLWAGCHGVTALLITVEDDCFPWVDHQKLIHSMVDTLVDGATV